MSLRKSRTRSVRNLPLSSPMIHLIISWFSTIESINSSGKSTPLGVVTPIAPIRFFSTTHFKSSTNNSSLVRELSSSASNGVILSSEKTERRTADYILSGTHIRRSLRPGDFFPHLAGSFWSLIGFFDPAYRGFWIPSTSPLPVFIISFIRPNPYPIPDLSNHLHL